MRRTKNRQGPKERRVALALLSTTEPSNMGSVCLVISTHGQKLRVLCPSRSELRITNDIFCQFLTVLHWIEGEDQ